MSIMRLHQYVNRPSRVAQNVYRAASPSSSSTITTSFHSPSSRPCRRYVPTSRKPSERQSARLATFSVNHQPWMPGPELPYIVAIIEIVEQPSVRLTTNLVNCAPDDARIEMPVRVTFEHHPDPEGDIYIPLFEPVEPGE